jgi:hypothetical protein
MYNLFSLQGSVPSPSMSGAGIRAARPAGRAAACGQITHNPGGTGKKSAGYD